MNIRDIIVLSLKNRSLLILIVLIFSSCSAIKIAKLKENSSIIAISATSTGLGAKGYGILITIENTDTKEIFKSKSLSPISAHSVIQNLSQGEYIVKKVEVPVGNLIYSNCSDSLKTFFGQINVEPNSKYYLGNFTGTRIVGKKNVLRLKIENQSIPDKLREKIENGKTSWMTGDFIKLYPYKKDTLLVF